MPTSYPPSLKFEVAFTTDPLSSAPVYTDVSSYVRGFSTRRGRTHELNRIEAGTATIVLQNRDRRFDPTNTASPHYPNVLPMRKARVTLNDGVTDFRIFTGYVERWPMPWDVSTGGQQSEVQLQLVDAFDFLGTMYLQTIHSTLTTTFGGNADLTFTSKGAGVPGNSLNVVYYVRPAGPNAVLWVGFGEPADGTVYITDAATPGIQIWITPVKPLTVFVSLQKAYPSGAIVSTAADVMAAVNSHPKASKYVTASLAAGADGRGVIPYPMPSAGTGAPQGAYLSGAVTYLTGGTYTSELSGTRVGHVLDDIGWPAAERTIDAGQHVVSAAGFDTKDQHTALSHLQETGETERGYVFMAGDGKATFHDAAHRAKGATPLVTFGDNLGAEIGYRGLTASFDRDEIRNDIAITVNSGSVLLDTDATSITRYGRRSFTATPGLTTDNEGQARADYIEYRYKDPHLRFETLQLRPGRDGNAWAGVLPREIGDRITVKRRPPGGGAAISQDCFIEQIEWGNSAQTMVATDVRYQLSPADLDVFGLFDDATYGKFDTARFGE